MVPTAPPPTAPPPPPDNTETDAVASAIVADDYDEDDEDEDEDDVSLGFAVERSDEPLWLLRNRFPSKLGGRPAWLDPVQLPLESQLCCAASGKPLRFLLQVYAPINEDPRAFHRMVSVFISPRGSLLGERGAVRAFRCQLPRANDYYGHEPADDDEPPTPLPTALAAIAMRRCARLADDDDAERGYREHELVVEPEPTAEEAAEEASKGGDAQAEQVKRLHAAYKAKMAAAGGGGEGGEGKEVSAEAAEAASEPDLSAFGPPDEELGDFTQFTARLARGPEQCLRYTYAEDAAPLWASRRRRPPDGAVPRCERCGGRRRFEFQVMPQAIHYLGVDSLEKEAPDWATIAVYTCAASCAPTPDLASADGVLRDPPDNDRDAAEARAVVGHAATISGLQSRPELNGTTATVLFWGGSGRWAVECQGGDKMRVRSANLTLVKPVAPFSFSGVEREGGYAEEFVWVQRES